MHIKQNSDVNTKTETFLDTQTKTATEVAVYKYVLLIASL